MQKKHLKKSNNFYDKNKLGIEKNVPHHYKEYICQAHTNILNDEKLKPYPLRSQTR